MNARDEFLRQFKPVVKSLGITISEVSELPTEFWRAQPEGRFGPGEILVHIMQSGRFVCRFVCEQLGLEPATELEPYFQKAAHSREALATLNLRGARKICGGFTTAFNFSCWLYLELGDIESRAVQVTPHMFDSLVSHPLVDMQGPCGAMLTRLLVIHIAYHLGQLTEQLKAAGYPVPYLPIFGTLPETSVKTQ